MSAIGSLVAVVPVGIYPETGSPPPVLSCPLFVFALLLGGFGADHPAARRTYTFTPLSAPPLGMWDGFLEPRVGITASPIEDGNGTVPFEHGVFAVLVISLVGLCEWVGDWDCHRFVVVVSMLWYWIDADCFFW
jgi:hypothetical protein